MKGAVDLMLLIEAEDDLLTFRSEKARDIEPVTFGERTNHIDGTFYLSPSEPKRKPIAIVKSQKYVLNYLNRKGDSLKTTICDDADICSDNAARKAIYKLVDDGLIYRTNAGTTGTGAIYDLTEVGKNEADSLSE